MTILVAGLVLFVGVHIFAALRSRAPGNIKEKMGRSAYMGVFSLVSAAGLGLLVWGYGVARVDPSNLVLWAAPDWTRHVVMAFMPLAMILLAAAYAPAGYIKKFVKHPMVTAVKLWAVVHLVSNGDLASVLLFASFLVFAVLSRIMSKKREAGTAPPKPNVVGDIISIVVGVAVYVGFVYWLHEIIVGVPVVA